MFREVVGYLRDDIVILKDWFLHLRDAHSKAGRAKKSKNLENT